MKGHPPPRRKQLSGAFRRSLLGAIFLGLSGLGCIYGALTLIATPRSNGYTPAYVVDQKGGWAGRRGLQTIVKSRELTLSTILARGSEKTMPSIGVAGLFDGVRQGPSRMRKEAERQLALKRKQSAFVASGGTEVPTRKERKVAGEISQLPQHLWGTYARLARQRVLLSESRMHDPGFISCGGSGTVGFRSWHELARSVEEFDARWFREEPDLRALVAAAQNTKPQKDCKPSCAVVGNSGRLLQHEYGAEIDAREMVFRFNWGTTKGYEKHVGSKSDVRIYNGPYVSQKQPGEVTIAEIRDPAIRQWLRKKKEEGADHAAAFDPDFLCHVWDWVGRSGDKPSTGLVGVILALRTCSSVDVYGFHYEDYFDPAIQPHYYDWERPKVGREKAHPFEREHQLYKQLESAGMLRLH